MNVPSPKALTCRDVVALVAEYLAGEMTAQDAARLEQHFHGCTWCAVYVDQLRLTSKALRQVAPGDLESASRRARLITHFRRLMQSP